jgi:adenosylhomocysteine nucleosidase
MTVTRSDKAPVIAVVAALPEELAPLRSRLTGIERRKAGGHFMEHGRLNGRSLALSVTGDGAHNARTGVAALLAASQAEGLIAIGVAGALSRGLATAALVVASRVTDEGGTSVLSDERRTTDVARATGGRLGVVLSAAAIVDRAADKQRLADQIGAGHAPAVVDLESATYVGGAVAAGVPWLVLRAVSDTADESLPDLLNRSRDGRGAIRRGQVLLGLLRQPQALPFLLTLRGRLGRCAEVLAQAVAAALPMFSPPRSAP